MLLDSLKKIALAHPENIAITSGEHNISYSNLLTIINKLANGLLNLGIKKGDRVAILLPNVPHFIFAYYSILKIGGIAVSINPLLKKGDIQFIIQDTQPTAFFIWEGFYGCLIDLMSEYKHIIMLGDKIPSGAKSLTRLIASESDDESKIKISHNDTAQIHYTQGVTNSLKGVELTHQNLISSTMSCMKMFVTNSSDRFAGLLPLFLLYSQIMIMNNALLQASNLILYPRIDKNNLDKAIKQDKVTFLAGSPYILDILLESEFDTNSLKYVLSIGSPCSEELLINFEQKINIPILEGYGTVEATGIISYNRTGPNRKNGSIGLPVEGVDIKIVDDNGLELEAGKVGEIIITGDNVMKGYWNQPLPENNVLRDRWLYTGDLGEMDNDGFLFFINRKEDVIVKGGFQIYPSEVEKVLLTHPQVDQVAIVGIPHPNHKQEVKACIVLKEGEQVTAEEIIEFCKGQIPVYKCPQIVQFYSSLPKSTTGKIVKKKLYQ